MKTEFIFLAHGSKNIKAFRQLENLIISLRQQTTDCSINMAFLEHLRPNLDQAVSSAINRKVDECHIIPLMLMNAKHLKHDIPNAVKQLKKKVDIVIKLKKGIDLKSDIIEITKKRIFDLPQFDAKQTMLTIVCQKSTEQNIYQHIQQQLLPLVNLFSFTSYQTISVDQFENFDATNKENCSHLLIFPLILWQGTLMQKVTTRCKELKQNNTALKRLDILDSIATSPEFEKLLLKKVLPQYINTF